MENFYQFILRQFKETTLKSIIFKVTKLAFILFFLPFYLFVIILIRFISPFFLVRIAPLYANRIGHCAQRTDMYLNRKSTKNGFPNIPYVDIFYIQNLPIANSYLIKMWRRKITIFPRIFLLPIATINHFIPGYEKHEVNNAFFDDRDVNNFFDKLPPNLEFTDEEERIGKLELKKMGIEPNSKFVTLIVRDSAYLKNHISKIDWSTHDYRDNNIDNFKLIAEELAKKNIYVIRMGANVKKEFTCSNSKIIDYATNGCRSEFMDIYLGAKCFFTISTSCGWDGIPLIFRKPIVYINMTPVGYQNTYSTKFITITKHHFNKISNKFLTFNEIINFSLFISLNNKEFINNQIELIENSPEEILDVVFEQIEWLENKNYIPSELEIRFWKIFSECPDLNVLHGEIRSRFGNKFLEKNKFYLN